MNIEALYQKITFIKHSGSGAGGVPIFYFPKNTKEVIEVLETLKQVFNPDGSYNLDYTHLESYALCLNQDEKYEEALKLFKMISTKETSELLPKQDSGRYNMTQNQKGKLGLEGMFTYARLLKKAGENKKAGILFKHIVDLERVLCGFHGGDIFAHSAQMVVDLNAYPLLEKQKYLKILEEARRNQH